MLIKSANIEHLLFNSCLIPPHFYNLLNESWKTKEGNYTSETEVTEYIKDQDKTQVIEWSVQNGLILLNFNISGEL